MKPYRALRPLEKPLTEMDLKDREEVDVVISIGLRELIRCRDLEGLNMIIDEKVTAIKGCLTEICYIVHGCMAAEP